MVLAIRSKCRRSEQNGKQVELVDSTGHPINFTNYFATKARMALQGQVYNPTLGFATIANVTGASHKYPFNPFYGGVSPRVAVAWNPKGNGMLGKLLGDGKTVIRAGYGQIYSRLNGVGLVLIPLLGVGLGQPVSCIGASSTGQCLGTGGVTPATAFRIGTDGLTAPIPTPSATLPQPSYPGTNGTPAAGAASVLDPSFRPAATYNFNFSIQREIRPKVLFEVGYIGRIITHEWMQRDLDAVPTMMTLGGQSFAQAFAGTYIPMCGLGPTCAGNTTVPVQPFFEAALGGANSSFCKGFSSCTAAVVANPTMNSFIQPDAGVPVVVRSQPGFLLDSGPHHSEQPECGASLRPGVGHLRRRQLRLVQLQCALHHLHDPGLAWHHDAIELHLGTRARYGQPVSGDVRIHRAQSL